MAVTSTLVVPSANVLPLGGLYCRPGAESAISVAVAAKLTAALARDRFDREVTVEEVRGIFAGEIARLLEFSGLAEKQG